MEGVQGISRMGGNSKNCNVGGKNFGEGERLKTADPCLECQCSGGRVDCRLRVCPKLPRPPPPGCFLLQRPASCCASLHCPQGSQHLEQARSNLTPKFSDQRQEGCILNGTVYGEGSAMVTSSLCEYCYCIRGTQHCVRPKCLLSVPACKPEYAMHSCCPTKYICSEMEEKADNSTLISTTPTPSTLPGPCTVEGGTFPEGERLTGLEKPCEICYCVKGKPVCDPVICDAPPPPHCSPVLSPGHCCPLSYNCSAVDEITTTSVPEMESKEIPNSDLTTLVDQTTPATTTSPSSDVETTTSEALETTVRPATDTEERFAGSAIDAMETTTSAQEDTTTTLLVEVRNGSGKVKVTPDVIEAIINRTLEKDQDYEYDYNEPSLPPSLPNLKIIPFLAADAVLHENEEDPLYAETNLKTPLYPDHLRTTETIYDTPITSMFSPPVETEGGFVPKDPSIDDPFFLVGIKPDHIIPPITESSKIISSEGDGPKLTNLPHVKDDETPTNYVPESLPNLPAITVADVVVTPNAFKDVIRTEPPPDLEDIMKDKPIHTTTTTSTTTTETPRSTTDAPSSPVFSSTSAAKISTATKTHAPTTTSAKTPVKSQDNSTDYDYGENLSISSFLDFFLSGGSDKSSTTTRRTTQQPQLEYSTTSTPHVVAPVSNTPSSFDSAEHTYDAEINTIVHKEAQDRNDFNISDTDELNGDAVNNVFTPEKDQLLNPSTNKSPPDASMSGLLKLAGCNIYGRIYRVGHIIDELSNPCLECLCTEMGPQKRYCRAPNCDASSDSEKLFQSPPDPVRLQIWKDRVGLDEPVKMFYICRRHFSTRSFNTVQRTTEHPGLQIAIIFPRGDVRKFASERTTFPPHSSLRTYFSEPQKNTQEELHLLKQRSPGRRRVPFQAKCVSCHDDPTRGLLAEEQNARAALQDGSEFNSSRTARQQEDGGHLKSNRQNEEAPYGFISTTPTWGSALSKATVKSITNEEEGDFHNSTKGSNLTFSKRDLEMEVIKCRGYCFCCMHRFVEGEQIHVGKILDGKQWSLEDQGERISFRLKVDEDKMFLAVLIGFIGLFVLTAYFAFPSCLL
ncbi:hypothetical protein GE061_017379 [Apolygus lucorum]|uniref:THAP-type domain-containing protein n=1 Tax=Apolygus lucorum TaxID=248454 RepID=A0A8S9XC97_APOLU|nr:hypothetical protein GE061_017379 [Apolygus lucorum]